jgi:hypothetical protein
LERMTGIEPALSAWEAPSVCIAIYSRIAYGATDLAISDGSQAASAVEILVENDLPHKSVAGRGAWCWLVRWRLCVTVSARGVCWSKAGELLPR